MAERAPEVAVVTGRRLALVVGGWVLAAGILGTFTVLAAPGADVTPVVVAEVYAVLIAALLLVIPPAKGLGLVRCAPADIGLAAVAVAGAYVVTAALQTAIGPWPWSSAVEILKAMGSDDGRLATAGPAVTALILVRACILAAVGEELLFRGALYTWLRQRWSAGVVIPITAAAHAAIHGFPAILPLAFVIGLGFGWVRERSGSTLPSVIVHALHNTAMIAASYWLTDWTARLPPWG